MNHPEPVSLTRRRFLGTAALAGTAAVTGFPAVLRAGANDKPLKIALVGCGGRGSGAAGQALKADPNVKLVAVADAFSDRLESSLKNLQAGYSGKVQVEDKHKFV